MGVAYQIRRERGLSLVRVHFGLVVRDNYHLFLCLLRSAHLHSKVKTIRGQAAHLRSEPRDVLVVETVRVLHSEQAPLLTAVPCDLTHKARKKVQPNTTVRERVCLVLCVDNGVANVPACSRSSSPPRHVYLAQTRAPTAYSRGRPRPCVRNWCDREIPIGDSDPTMCEVAISLHRIGRTDWQNLCKAARVAL